MHTSIFYPSLFIFFYLSVFLLNVIFRRISFLNHYINIFRTTQGGLKLIPTEHGDDEVASNGSKAGLVHVTTTELEPMSNVRESIKLA